ncbi:hypothetical protein DPMN_031318 [Dreissena polymorpha]|uniref:Uncharacterized protein n=1 Tax=Dreissena polymorpha TaxID=45954 RepID=A0A9D4M0R8_DREPO|nr:hypothetical protein DPMN_031318 [Dreissena polymorpha]
MVYLSSAVNGITLSVVNGMFRISAETTTMLWEIILSPVQVNKWFYFEINWTEMFGLQLFIDGVLIRSEVAGIGTECKSVSLFDR